VFGVNEVHKIPFESLKKRGFIRHTCRNFTANLDIAWALSTQDLNIPWSYLSLHRQLQVYQNALSKCVFFKYTHWNPRMLFWKYLTYNILGVPKSVAWFQKDMQIKLAKQVWKQVKMTFIPLLWKVNYIHGEAYFAISLMCFVQKRREYLLNLSISNETLGRVP
jgi:hypothetical protein